MTAELRQARSRRADECLFCSSRRCYTRIRADNGMYDEVACRDHGRDLEQHADRHLGRMLRTSTSSSSPLRRERLRPWVVFLISRQRIGGEIRLAGKSKPTTEFIGEAETFESEIEARGYIANEMLPHIRHIFRPIVGRMD